jgi:uncharacterized protein (DUF697 family)
MFAGRKGRVAEPGNDLDPLRAGKKMIGRILLKPLPALGKSRGEGIVTAVFGVVIGRQLRGRYSRPMRAFVLSVAAGVTA